VAAANMTTPPTLDVYARTFVPEFLRTINRASPRHVHPLLNATVDIDLATYVRTFFGTDFIDDGPATRASQPRARTADGKSLENVTTESYRDYTSSLLHIEIEALHSTQAQYDLFRVPLVFNQTASPAEIVLHTTFPVPGLGENSPYVRVGDICLIRPLALDGTGGPLQSIPIYENGLLISSPLPIPGWNGNLFHAEVIALKRKEELISVRITFTHQAYASIHTRLHSNSYNVQFPPRETANAALWRATDVASNLLNSRASSYASALKNGSLSPAEQGWMHRMLFPDVHHGKEQTVLNSVRLGFDQIDKQLNHEQLRAVDAVVAQNYGNIPYIIHGPPGTGKTKTMVEIVLQLLSRKAMKHLLVCAPSDPAADTLTERLRAHLVPGEMLRLCSPARTFAEVKASVMPYCYVNGEMRMFGIPPFRKVMKYKVVVTTCKDADLLNQASLSNRALRDLEFNLLAAIHGDGDGAALPHPHWDGLLLDEAAQATELDALIPLTVVATSSHEPQVESPILVLAGDQQQLGPRTASRNANVRASLFERLLQRPLYANHPLARHRLASGILAARPLTRSMLPMIRPPFANLLRNYRSHPAILAVPNALFYHETLIPEATNTTDLMDWQGWAGSWPVLFVNNNGQDDIETDGGGWFNVKEIDKAFECAISLLSMKRLVQEEICIMSPFSAQVRRLRNRFRGAHLHDVDIGPMEAFQGLESKVVILCTTRSRTRFLDQDQARDFGIIYEPNRFNVAITRAKQGLIVIGNREVLSVDPCWRAFLDFCVRNELCDGQLSEDARDIAEGAPVTTLERILKQSEGQTEPTTLALTGELHDPMWIIGTDSAGGDDGPGEEDFETDEGEEGSEAADSEVLSEDAEG
jgi:hypothetical protein